MGVVHKLKKEISDFIIQAKLDEPALSCRTISYLIQDKFQVEVSKSSVNNTIKRARLSSRVGRRKQKDMAKKFQIPLSKKKQLSENVARASSGMLIEHLKKASTKSSTPTGPQRGLDAIDIEALSAPEAVEEKEFGAETMPAEPKQRRWSKKLKGCGAIFLKAVLWELSDRPFLADFLSDNAEATYSKKLVYSSEYLLWSYASKKALFSEISDQAEGFLAFSGATLKDIDLELVGDLSKKLFISSVYEKFEHELGKLFACGRFIQLTLEDKTRILFDSQLAGVWRTTAMMTAETSVYKAMRECEFCLIQNQRPLILNMAAGLEEGSRKIYQTIACLENFIGKKIREVSLFDNVGSRLAGTSFIPNKKREFILAVWPWQKEFGAWLPKQVTGENTWPFEDGQLRYKSCLRRFRDNQKKGYSGCLKSIFISERNHPICVLLTNMIELRSSKLISLFYERWPLFQNSRVLEYWRSQHEKDQPEEVSALKAQEIRPAINKEQSAIDAFACRLFQRMQSLYFDPLDGENSLLNALFSLEGFLFQDDKHCEVKLIVPENAPFRHGAILAGQIINERHIFTPKGQQIKVHFIS